MNASAVRHFKTFSFVFLCSFTLYAGEDWKAFPIGPFLGLNNRDNSYAIGQNQSQDLLNVDLTPGGKSVRKRRGYGQAFALANTTSAVHGVYDFFDSNGNEVSLFFNDTKIASSISGLAPTILLSTGPNGATYQCTDSLGQAYCTNTSRTTLYKISGSTLSQIQSVASTGTMVATAVTRLAMTGFSDAPSRIDFSAETDFTTWGSGSLGTSPAQFTINAPGAKITHIVYAFNRLMWFKDTSFGYILIGNQPAQSDWVIKTVAYDVGTNDNTSVYREGLLYFRGKDGHIYVYDGYSYQRLTREISGTINQSQTRSQNAWMQSTKADFDAGNITTATWLNTDVFSGSVALTTAAAISDFIDAASSDYVSGTLVNIDTFTNVGSIQIKVSTKTANLFNNSGIGCPNNSAYTSASQVGQSFYFSSNSARVPYFQFQMIKPTSGSNFVVGAIKSDSSGSPGSTITVSSQIDISSYASSGNVPVSLATTTLTINTTYWLVLSFAGPSTGLICDDGGTNSFPFGKSTISSTKDLPFLVDSTAFFSTASIISRTFDTTIDTGSWTWQWANFATSGSIPYGSSITYRLQFSPDASNWSSPIVITTGTGNLPVGVSRYVRYLSTFTTITGIATPLISSVTISSTQRMRPWGTFDSAVNNAPNITAWDALAANIVTAGGGSHTFYLRSATGSFTTTSTSPAWVPVANGAISTGAVNPYFQVRDLIQTGNYASNPLLNDFTVNWFEGNATDKSYATYFEDKILWSLPIGSGTTTNNRILLYDLLNQTWLVYDLASNGFYVKANKLYFGSSSSGYIYKYGDVDSDNGAAINSYWKSKDFYGGDPFTTQELANISIIGKAVSSSSMTVMYTINGSSSAVYLMPLTTTKAFAGFNKNLPAGFVGSNFNVQIGNNAANQTWEIFGIQVGIRPRSWLPGGP